MSHEKNEPMNGRTIILICYFCVLMLLLCIIGIFDRFGWKLIKGDATFLLFGLLVCSALVLMFVFLTRKISKKILKYLVGIVGVVVTIAAGATMFMLFSAVSFYQQPHLYCSMNSPGGKQAVVMRTISGDLEKMDVRAKARTQSEESGDKPDYEISDIGFQYRAYPKKLLLFYDSTHPSEGVIERGYESKALLKYEWRNESLIMYLEDADPGDEGEVMLPVECF